MLLIQRATIKKTDYRKLGKQGFKFYSHASLSLYPAQFYFQCRANIRQAYLDCLEMLVEVVSEVLRAPMDSTSEVFKDSRDLSLLVVWGGKVKD